MQVIGKGKLLWNKYTEYVSKENELSARKKTGWYEKVRYMVPSEVEDLIWNCMVKTGEGQCSVLCAPSESITKQIKEHMEFLDTMEMNWEVLYWSEYAAVLRSGELMIGVPPYTVEYTAYENVENIPIGELRNRMGITEKQNEIVLPSGLSCMDMKNNISDKQSEIEQKKIEIANLEKEKKEELERIKQELEQKYADKLRVIEEKKAEMEAQMNVLQGQMFMLDTEIYSIRCFMGETIDFIPLVNGKYSSETESVVIYQKVRYLDEEMGKWLALYDFDGDDIKTFEEILKNREDIRDLFAPGPKSVSLIKVAKSQFHLCDHPMVANVLKRYEVFHGKKIGILLRDGENLWIGWTDEERINIPDGNAFFRPETREETIQDENEQSSTKEEVASRYFVYCILRGMLQKRKLIRVPEGIDLSKPSPYVIFSMADGWLEDNRYGTFADIVKRTDMPLLKGDMILTTMTITRDDANSYKSKNMAWNNDRGRGERNRTHDASIPNRMVMPINCIDTEQEYNLVFRKYRLDVKDEIEKKYVEEGIEHTRMRPVTRRTNEYLGTEVQSITVFNNMYHKFYSVKGLSPEQVLELIVRVNGEERIADKEYITGFHRNYAGSYYLVFDHIELGEKSEKCYVSAHKKDSYNWWETGKDSFANMEIMPDEYLNLTFLNSIYLVYAIQNRKMGGWRRGNKAVEYSDGIPYLNMALAYVREREETEAELLEKYMELYEGWQVDLSEWRLSHNYHRLTDTRAKRFAKEKSKAGE